MARSGITINTRWQLKEVNSLMNKLQPPRLNWALRNAVNDTAKQVERQAERDVTKKSSIPRKRVKAGIYIHPRATDKLFEATIVGSNSPIPLKVFKAREMKKGLRVKIWAQRKLYPHAFMKGGTFPDRKELNLGGPVFQRIGKKRLPLKKEMGASVAEAMIRPTFSNTLVNLGQERMMVNLKRQLSRYARPKRKEA